MTTPRSVQREGNHREHFRQGQEQGPRGQGQGQGDAGKAVGNERLEAEGAADQTKANVKQAGEKVKDAGKSLKP